MSPVPYKSIAISFIHFATTLFVILPLFHGAKIEPKVPEDAILINDVIRERPRTYFDVLANAARIVGRSGDSLQEKFPFVSTLKGYVLDFQRLGYESIVENLLEEVHLSADEYNSGSAFGAKTPDNVLLPGPSTTSYGERVRLITDYFKKLGSSPSDDGSNETMSTLCLNDTARILIGIIDREGWVIPFLDSTGKPGPSLSEYRFNLVGNYKQCRASIAPDMPSMASKGFLGNYCVLKTGIKGSMGVGPQIGLCVPSSCSSHDMTILARQALESANVSSVIIPLPADCHNEEREFTTATIIAIVVLSIITCLLVVGTLYDLFLVQRPQWIYLGLMNELEKSSLDRSQCHNHQVSETDGGGEDDTETKPLMAKTVIEAPSGGSHCHFLMAFSVYTNGKKVLSTRQGVGSLGAVHGIRFLSMTWVVLGHTFAFSMGSIDNLLDVQAYLQRWTFDAVSNAYPSVDTFFTLSGLLTGYLTIKHFMTKNTWKINWPLFYFHRFWRLTPPYMLMILAVLGLQRFLGSGALWDTVQPMDKEVCEKRWWTNLLYINNLVTDNTMGGCFAHSWYLANDMQFFVLSPLMLIPFYFHYMAGIASCSIFLLVTWITTAVLSVQNNWPAALLSANMNFNLMSYFMDYYIVPWCRIGPYVVGLMTGYLLAVTQGGKHLRMKWWMVFLGWLVAAVAGFSVIYGIDGTIHGQHPATVGAAALYNAVSRSVWGACVCWVIVACAAGYGGPVNALLSWSPFVFLGKLTYMVYLIHPAVIYVYVGNREYLFFMDDTNITIMYLGLLTFTHLVAFVLVLALESPWIVLEKVFIRKERQD